MKKRKKILYGLLTIMAIGLIMPQNLKMPVAGATKSDYNSQSFWFDPWGKSGTHKGVDIFADKGTDVNSATQGIVLFVGEIKLGGKVILILGPKWRLHYYAHLDKLIASSFSLVSRKSKIGTVGDSGNAKGKQPHLHYSIMTAIPYPWRIDMDRQGWKKMFYLNPITYFRE